VDPDSLPNMDCPLDDEIMSINAIYGPDTLALVDDVARAPPPATAVCILRFPNSSVTLRLQFPDNYPDAPPSILGTESTGTQVRRGVGTKIADATREVLARVYRIGEPCVYDLIEEMSTTLEDEADTEPDAAPVESLAPAAEQDSISDPAESAANWIVGAQVTEKKSVFVARAASVASPDEAKGFLRQLLADKKIGRATHNIVAWRIRGADGTSYQDCDDDGETAAGGRLLHLLQLMDAWDVCVVVSRWYGGVKLGPDRFRIINSAARDVLVAGQFTSK
jgi:hypothetical protein